MNYKKINDEVLYLTEDGAAVSQHDLVLLKELAAKNPRQRIRLCAHRETTDKVHEMFIVLSKSAYIRPHKHLDKTESFFIIKGEADVIFFDEGGNKIKTVAMGPPSKGKIFYFRFSEPLYHTLRIKSPVLYFLEVTSGPFDPTHTIFPSWAPDGSDDRQVAEFMKRL